MGDHTPIEWVRALAEKRNAIPATWNPIDGCSRATAGCRLCYAAQLVHVRLSKSIPGRYAGLTELDAQNVPRFNGVVRLAEHVLDAPKKARRPRVYFVCDMADLFHPNVPWDWLDRIFATMAATPQHTYLLLTKRPDVLMAYAGLAVQCGEHWLAGQAVAQAVRWPLPNVWIGTTVTDQKDAAANIPLLLSTPAVMRFISAEPLLGPVDLTAIQRPFDDCLIQYDALDGRWHEVDGFSAGYGMERINWVIAGGESGGSDRPAHPDWFRSLRDQCTAVGVPFLFKQWGEFREFDTGGPDVETVEADDQFSIPVGYHPCELGAIKPHFVTPDGRCFQHFHDIPEGTPARLMERAGKKAAGRVLDGRTWDQVPEVA
ncbi:phage Gp37/Gp68 family protein [Azospirillum doebereinerae]|uniref:phage Gp37/Gp68 family protein n=1 Tax=Azospirillum doebereinerae TaxID=92933 RepID=UPI001EE621A9|nr:phage Gp37/Gp68 family protein [Azospirillum doebereinerae]MCG5240073.1 phage Gp37/Gp68 family protein [Azospirillum doebereinerae]